MLLRSYSRQRGPRPHPALFVLVGLIAVTALVEGDLGAGLLCVAVAIWLLLR